MATKNLNLSKCATNSPFNEIGTRIAVFRAAYPKTTIHMMGIGNTSQPLSATVVKALCDTSTDLGYPETYEGYGDPVGNLQLREAISNNYYKPLGISVAPSEIFVSDGAQSDSTNIQELFDLDNQVAVQNPMYPLFVEGNLLAGRDKFIYLRCNEQDDFIPVPPKQKVSLIYLNFPNNPTGAVATKKQLQAFVDYARSHKAVIIFDAVYSAYITNPNLPKSIYEVDGAQECAIEINSFSKRAGFTGLRLGWSVVPHALTIKDTAKGELTQMWRTRQSTKFWGASILAQKGGIAALSAMGQQESQQVVNYYLENARILKKGLEAVGLKSFGGIHNPFIWVKTPGRMNSWQFFDQLLYEVNIAGIPGCLFGSSGEGYLRLSTLGHREVIEKAVKNIQTKLSLPWMNKKAFVA